MIHIILYINHSTQGSGSRFDLLFMSTCRFNLSFIPSHQNVAKRQQQCTMRNKHPATTIAVASTFMLRGQTHQKCTRDSHRSFGPWPGSRVAINGNQWTGSYVQLGPPQKKQRHVPCHEILVLTPRYICISKNKCSTSNINLGVLMYLIVPNLQPQSMTGWPQLPKRARSKELPPQCWR